jgi:P27 family predicted phage terminase small subunit
MGGTGSGRIPKPAKLKLLEGRSRGHDTAGRPVPQPPAFERVAPQPPDDLTETELALWNLVADDLGPQELLKNSDYGILLLYVHAWSQYFAAKRLADASLLIKNPQTEVVHRNPAVSIMAETRRDLIRIGAELGLSPSAEQRFRAALSGNSDDGESNPFDWAARYGTD